MLWQDIRYGARMLAGNPGFTIVSVVTLALGIGANTMIFSLLDTLYWRPLPVADASRVLNVFQTHESGRGETALSFPDYIYYRDHNRSFSALAAHYSNAPINLATADGSKEINGAVVTANYFGLLGLQPALGRFFAPEEDDVPDRNPVAVISDELWRTTFHRDAQPLGRSLRLNGTAFTIVGVAPQTFQGVTFGGLAVDVWIPSAMFRVGYRYCDVRADRDCHIVRLIGRLKDGATAAAAQSEMSVLAGQLDAARPAADRGLGVSVEAARGVRLDRQRGEARVPALLAMAVALLLLIACANIAGLLLARSLKRRKEIAIRLAIGAGRRRLVAQLMTESVMLALAGGAGALLVTFWAKDLLLTFYTATSEGQRAYFVLDPDPIVLAATAAVSILAGVLFGLVPALQTSRPDVLSALKDDGRSGTSRSWMRDVLVVAQVASSIVLLVGAGLLVRSLSTVYGGQGFDPRPILLLRLRPSLIAQPPARAKAFQQDVIRRVEALPGVEAASPAAYPPLPGWDNDRVRMWLPGQPAPVGRTDGYWSGYNEVGPHYFQTLAVPLLRGRDFDDRDRAGTLKVAIVNDTVADRFWPGGNGVGESLVVDGERYQVVGVVRSSQYRSHDEAPRPMVFLDYWQHDTIDTRPIDSRTHVRVAGDPRAMLQTIRQAIAAADPSVPISEDRPLTEWLDYTFGPVRAAGRMLIAFSVLAVFLSAIGLYGVLASTVSQRTREIAIRMALGAESGDVARLVVRQGAVLALAGTGIGVVVALMSARALSSFLYGVSLYDPLTVVATCVGLIGIALVASYLPARRAMRVDPMVALRYE
ncbi:MAG TPA: ABC transporter permease [Vicinamibacterales bacterium]